MSGLAGIYQFDDRPVSPERLARLTDCIAHRGPDDAGRWIDGPTGLAHLAFHTTPESIDETQPLCDPRLSLCVTLDGRVDNRQELLSALESAGAPARTRTDAEIVLRAYQTWGAACPTRIIGDFAFAIWDGPNRQLFCARDPLGFKPLYYHADEHGFVCGSELRQLLEGADLAREPNEAMVGEHLARAITSTEDTLYAGIRRLPPGHVLIVRPSGLQKTRYWPLATNRELTYRTDGEYAEHFREIFEEAVRCRLRSHGPVGAELSGGLDSSSVVSMASSLAKQGSGDRLQTFSLVYPGLDCDESAYVRDVVRRWDLTSHTLEWREADAGCYAETVRRFQDVPVYPNGAMSEPLRFLARAKGCRVLLTGNGGDQWLRGSPRHYADLVRRFRFATLVRERRLDGRDGLVKLPTFPVLRLGLWPLVPRGIRRFGTRAMGHDRPPAWIGQDFASRVHLAERLRQSVNGPAFPRFAQRDLYRMSTSGWEVHFAEMEERTASGLGVETRHPLMDQRLVEFALALPGEQRRQQGLSKFVLRGALRGLLPDPVARRTSKAEFSHAFATAFRVLGGERAFASLRIVSMGWVDGGRVQTMYRQMAQLFARGDQAYIAYVWPLWMVLAIELWFTTVFVSAEGTP